MVITLPGGCFVGPETQDFTFTYPPAVPQQGAERHPCPSPHFGRQARPPAFFVTFPNQEKEHYFANDNNIQMGAWASALQEIMIANVFLSSPALGTTKLCGPPLPEWAGIRADSRIIPALSLSGRAQVAIVDAKNGIKEGLQGN
ncbi:hypothetical protein KUCAC02_004323 [Chaenocephalus aceratus]|uniref:Uncharacterized protein n=1 Tax=Chaenocephalus aceratus TaxID=36190 RepID=A0ACB9WZ38_CHAAC|nr:hypothetical protein KUCAC02_004323 [Chaenocephalus aceratus]